MLVDLIITGYLFMSFEHPACPRTFIDPQRCTEWQLYLFSKLQAIIYMTFLFHLITPSCSCPF
eukprot:c28243_g1_i1 orf=1-186(-)